MATLNELWGLLAEKDLGKLTDDELAEVAAHAKPLAELAMRVHFAVIHGVAVEQRRREKKKELEQLPTEKLAEMAEGWHRRRVASATAADDSYDPMASDPPSISRDSDESVVAEILKEREAAMPAAASQATQ